ncbi:Phage major capsid protein E [Fulvimarina manganoxydans]|uniref:Phage major capsid protein E n=1 Tax=Fulvimarina manganoxydans TaxID=937218 RepID=A0A1W1Y8N3_9HYPH|nr:major capsid protein [Fulvimarina manganoxydans]SMC32517.1 Phage major capsid protein E [Fulvimarina manganoxydans]
MDVFELAPFTMLTMAAAVIKRPFKPNVLTKTFRAGTPLRSPTTDVQINSSNGRVKVLPSTPRGAPAPQRSLTKRSAVKVEIPGYSEGFTMSYNEVLNVVGGLTGQAQQMAAQTLIDQYLAGCNDDLDVTVEHQLANAMKGLIVDSSGELEIDLYDMMKVQQQQADLDLSKPLAPQLEKLKLAMEKALGGDTLSSVAIVSGSDVAHAFSENGDYRKAMTSDARNNWTSQEDGRTGVRINSNVDIVPYHRGFFDADDCYAVPIYDGHMKTVYGPSDSKEYLGNVLDRYVTRHELPHGKGLEVELWSFFLHYFDRPEAIIKLNVA